MICIFLSFEFLNFCFFLVIYFIFLLFGNQKNSLIFEIILIYEKFHIFKSFYESVYVGLTFVGHMNMCGQCVSR